MTQPSVLVDHGFLCFAKTMPGLGPQEVTFNPDTGYAFTVETPSEREPLLLSLLKRDWNNPLHLCFHDEDVADYMGVFVRFLFYLPEQNMT